MNRIMDVSPQRRGIGDMNNRTGNGGGNPETPRESHFNRLRNFCANSCPRTTSSWVIALLSAVLVWQVLVSWSVLPSLTFPMVSGDKWQAMFLTNGQVYFGHLKEVNRDYIKMGDIYYLQTSQQLQSSAKEQQQQITLIKLGNELHGPEDMMFIPKNQVVFWENMKSDSKVVQAIDSMLKADASKNQ